MKKLFILSVMTLLFTPVKKACGQSSESFEAIEFQKQKIFYKGEKINKSKIKELKSIIHPINDPKADALLEGYKTIQLVSYVPMVAGLGCVVAAATKSNQNLEGLNDMETLLYSGIGLSITGLAVHFLGWPLKGKQAVLRYNEVVESKALSGISFELKPATNSLGLGLRIRF